MGLNAPGVVEETASELQRHLDRFRMATDFCGSSRQACCSCCSCRVSSSLQISSSLLFRLGLTCTSASIGPLFDPAAVARGQAAAFHSYDQRRFQAIFKISLGPGRQPGFKLENVTRFFRERPLGLFAQNNVRKMLH